MALGVGPEHLLAGGVLEPARHGRPVSYRPPGWDERGRSGSIVVPTGTRVLIVEGVGATRRRLAPLLDATVWMQADEIELERRNEARVAAGEVTPSNHRAWMAEENPFLLDDRAWERATVVVAGTPSCRTTPGPRSSSLAADRALTCRRRRVGAGGRRVDVDSCR